MNIDELLLAARQLAPQIAASCCVVNGAIMNLDEIEKMGYQKFGLRSKLNMPRKLYKYFPNIAKKSDENVINLGNVSPTGSVGVRRSPLATNAPTSKMQGIFGKGYSFPMLVTKLITL